MTWAIIEPITIHYFHLIKVQQLKSNKLFTFVPTILVYWSSNMKWKRNGNMS